MDQKKKSLLETSKWLRLEIGLKAIPDALFRRQLKLLQ